MTRSHLFEVWDPADGSEYMHAHLRVLLVATRQFRAGRRTERDVHVWWGHMAAKHQASPIVVRQCLNIPVEQERNDPAPETHLYLTDYSSLYVAHLGSVTTDDPHRLRDNGVPHLYKRQHCQLWYRLWDIRRLVDNDSIATARELRTLTILDDGRPLLPHYGLPALPLVVRARADVRYFDPVMRKHFIQERFWVEHDADRSGVGAIEMDLRDNCFGADAWYSYGALARSFIATGERLWRDHGRDAHFDHGLTLLEFAKAIEVQCNTVVRRALHQAPSGLSLANIDGTSRDVTTEWLSLGQLARLISEPSVAAWLSRAVTPSTWFVSQLPAILDALADLRNHVAHGDISPEKHVVAEWREQLLGIGHYGHLIQLGKLVLKSPSGCFAQ